ncbi:hypothetical protein HZR84_00825 [Hyphobacterium sp. CCMP332]|nr:hypothetical protein HZR84_00825 [Hyphobacterium sp. CCMP332]
MIVLDSMFSDSDSNSYTFRIYIDVDSERKVIWSYEVMDYSVISDSYFQNDSMQSFTFYSLPSGSKWSVFQIQSKVFLTDFYNNKATNDSIDFKSISRDPEKVRIISGDGSESYFVSARLIGECD